MEKFKIGYIIQLLTLNTLLEFSYIVISNPNYQIISVKDLLLYPLSIPNYQRPYKWSTKNIADLLSDIDHAIGEHTIYSDFKYRIGTIILYKTSDGTYEIVDGQQRCISLLLIYYILCNQAFESNLLTNEINPLGKENICDNYRYIANWLSLKSEQEKDKIKKSFESILECVVLIVKQEREAFQLFDSQNARGKELYPHDLLKAYHLREMSSSQFDMLYAVEKWEAIQPELIKDLFEKYLFPILNWSRKEKTTKFSVKDIDVYKGIKENSLYPYAKRVNHAMPIYQISEPFISGNDFFEMVTYYVRLLEYIKKEIMNIIKKISPELLEILQNDSSIGFNYTKILLECALLYYYDKFKVLDSFAVKNIITWAFMLRVDMEVLPFASINNYAIGNESQYSNNLPLFAIIRNSRLHSEIGTLTINVSNNPRSNKWKDLLRILRKINGYEQ